MKISVILLIDDEAIVAKAVQMVLKRAGLEVLVATSAAAAIEAWDARKDEIGLVITDWSLDSQTNGEQLLERFRADRPDLKSILCSAYPLRDLLTNRNRTEGLDYFQKPIASGELVAAVRRTLER